MRILRSIRSVNPAVGGPVESVTQSSRALVARGHTVEVISLDAPDDPWVQNAAVSVHALGPCSGTYGYAKRFVPWIKERRAEYDAVIVHGLWQYNSFGVWRGLHAGPTPYYVFPHGMLDPWFKRTYPLKHLKKLLYWPWADYRVLRDAKAVFFTSEEERRLARKSFALYRCNETVVNYGTSAPAVDLTKARAEFLGAFPTLRGKRVLLFLSRLHEKKGCDLLIEAFAHVSRTHPNDELQLVLAGPPASEDYRRHLHQLTAKTFGDDVAKAPVTFCGMLTGDLKWGAFAAADAFILPSHQENFGISVVEALATGLPVLISNCVNIWREIAADRAGLVENDNVSGATRLMERWLSLSADERAAMRARAKECFRNRFEIDRATESLLAVLQSADARKATRANRITVSR
ncbi:MAG: glycosyltransferase [Verrucomicrobiota bacterium]|nr:glycosyltransferase [Verrucomicrobiota bacterium]